MLFRSTEEEQAKMLERANEERAAQNVRAEDLLAPDVRDWANSPLEKERIALIAEHLAFVRPGYTIATLEEDFLH